MKIIILLVLLTVSGRACASEESFAIWRNLEVTTHSVSRAGPIRVKATSGEAEIERFEIIAFGRPYSLSEGELKEISKFPLHSLSITHEAGYQITGGYSVHFKFRRVYYDQERKLRDEVAVITVTQDQGLKPVVIREKSK